MLKPLTEYIGFSDLKSTDAGLEKIEILTKILWLDSLWQLENVSPSEIIGKLWDFYQVSWPRSIWINPTPICNRICTFCSSKQRNRINIEDGVEIWEQKIKELLTDFEKLWWKWCVLVWGGEALLACNGNLNIILPEFDLEYGFNTNWVNLNKFVDQRLFNKTRWISLSILAHNKDLYNKVAWLPEKSNQFEILHNNLIEYLRIANEKKSLWLHFPYISAKILICKENYLFVWKIYNYIRSLWFNDISIRCVNNFETSESYRWRTIVPQNIELWALEKTDIETILLKETILSKERIDNITKWDKDDIVSKNDSQLCWNVVLWLMVNIDTDWEVYLCNPRLWQKDFSIWNINYNTFEDIWRSQKHVDVVKKTFVNFHKFCDVSKCRHYRVDNIIQKIIQYKIRLTDRTSGDILMKNFP